MKKIKYFLLTKSIGFGLNTLSYIQPKKATQIAYQLFSEPRKGKLTKDNLPYVLKNIPSQRFPADETHLETYIWKGNSTVILLVHGWESNTSRWEKLLPYLQQTGSTIVALDAPGHGLSGGQEFNIVKYATFIDVAVKQYKPSVLIGHSIGGAACIYYQSQFKDENITKMVILGAPSDYAILIDNYIQLLSLNKKMCVLLENYFSQKFCMNVASFTMSNFAKNIDLPALIVHDTEDEIVSFGEGQKIATSWKKATFIQTKGLGHSLHDALLHDKILTFLRP